MFQMEALARNNFLPPWTVRELLRKIQTRLKEYYNLSWQVGKKALRPVCPTLTSKRYGVTLYGPDAEAKNRILRRFPDHTEYFIRVQFCDEDGTDLQFNSRVSNDEIYERFKQIMISGIAICGRVYGFLGYSHSSLRNHSAWFGNIRSLACCAARIGDSMVKFESTDIENPEICDAANKPVPLVLNRQMIKILEDMGLPAKWFLDQQTAALEILQLVTVHISNTTSFLER
ncbi:hypothetical protein DM02DRAFT_635040 [Periconia macrospinosa]|uniref:RNA-dependent RNA polymerase n=1 Tax=Periconia macrospinosa TaxID=97972 RepID=A0A2V1D6R6_9PLEO|nr:hypothetical protein DM02DRAFT_635040 [Periconia macrospinosa]